MLKKKKEDTFLNVGGDDLSLDFRAAGADTAVMILQKDFFTLDEEIS